MKTKTIETYIGKMFDLLQTYKMEKDIHDLIINLRGELILELERKEKRKSITISIPNFTKELKSTNKKLFDEIEKSIIKEHVINILNKKYDI